MDDTVTGSPRVGRQVAGKLPQITLVFWIMKIAATTLGETAGDLLAQTMKVGYLVSSAILVGLFLLTLVTQLRVRGFHPALYWTVILSTSTAGTTMSDFMNRTAGLGYFRGALLYWTAILFSNTLGTSLGDFLADDTHLGFAGGALLISGLLALVVIATYLTAISTTLLFWVAFVLTRPLGATTGDFFSKPLAKGGLGYGTIGASLILAAVLLALIACQTRRSTAIP
jgi:uncharacterized membrane-anchored protein